MFTGIYGLAQISTQTMFCAPTHSGGHTYPESEVRPVAPDVISVITSSRVFVLREEMCVCCHSIASFYELFHLILNE